MTDKDRSRYYGPAGGWNGIDVTLNRKAGETTLYLIDVRTNRTLHLAAEHIPTLIHRLKEANKDVQEWSGAQSDTIHP